MTEYGRYLPVRWLALSLAFLIYQPHSVGAQLRGLWVDAWNPGFCSPAQTTRLVADCRRYNFNAVFVQMRRRGDAFYTPSGANLEPRTAALPSGYDALVDLISKAHSGTPRIEVHFWFASNLIWSGALPPRQPSHVFNRHPEFLTKSSGGKTIYPEGYFLDPGNPDAMLWNYTAATNIVSRYALDGFHWDYIRYPGADSGFNDLALARYQAETGSKERPLPNDARFSEWRRRQVTDFLRWADADLLKIRPALIISAAVFANRIDAFSSRFQDWADWTSEGIVDACIPMNYSPDNTLFRQRLDDAARHQGARRIYMGQGAYLNTKENSAAQCAMITTRGLHGFNIYSYGTLERGIPKQDRVLAFLKKKNQNSWVPAPDYPWKAKYGILKGAVTIDGKPSYNAVVTVNAGARLTQKTGAHGKFAFYDLPPGTYTATVWSAGKTQTSSSIIIAAGRVDSVDFKFSSTPVVIAPRISN